MTPHYVDQGGELNRLLDDLVGRVPQVTTAVMLTHDGGVPYPAGRPEGTAVDGRNADVPGADGAPVDATAPATADPPAARRALGGLGAQPPSDDGRSIRSSSIRGVVA